MEKVLETVQKAAKATAASKKGKGTSRSKGKAAELISEPDIHPSNEGNPFLEFHFTSAAMTAKRLEMTLEIA